MPRAGTADATGQVQVNYPALLAPHSERTSMNVLGIKVTHSNTECLSCTHVYTRRGGTIAPHETQQRRD